MSNNEDKKVIPPEEVKDNAQTVSVPKDEWKDMLAFMKRIEAEKSNVKPKRVKEHTAYLRLYNGLPILGYNRPKLEEKNSKFNNKEDKRLFIKITTKDLNLEEDKSTDNYVDYLDLLNDGERVDVNIIKQEAKINEVIKEVGRTVNPDPINNKKFSSDDTAFIDSQVEYVVEIEITEGDFKGKKLKTEAKNLNF